MRRSFAMLLLVASALVAATPAHADFTEESYGKHNAGMLRLFSSGTKPPADSPFVGTWKWRSDPEKSLTFLPDGGFKTTESEGGSSEGKWVHISPTDHNPVRAAFRIKDQVTGVKIEEGKVWVSGGDHWIELEKVPSSKTDEQKSGK